MKKPLDKITEAYFGNMGAKFSEKVRERIHWICENASGENLLDVGCSQGIISILLGREGKKVLAVDLLEESIEYAKNALEDESEITKKYVDFQVANFMDYDFKDQTFDSIIFGEILEHITDTKRFIDRASTLISENGKIIVTVPFGINDYFDHKKTYYLLDIINLANSDLEIKEIKFFGKWIGAIFTKQSQGSSNNVLTQDLVQQLESSFYNIERNSLNEIEIKNNKIKSLIKAQDDFSRLKEEYLNIKKELSNTKTKEQELINSNEELKQQLLNSKELLLDSTQSKINSEELLVQAYEREEKLLNEHKQLLGKYKALSNSKLGKLTLSYWKRRN